MLMAVQVFLPLLQGTIWSLALHGWRFWNRSAQLNGSSVGAKARRWWYRTNNWKVPNMQDWGKNKKLADEMGDVSRARSGLGGVPCFTDVM
jgi:hypothetical protein